MPAEPGGPVVAPGDRVTYSRITDRPVLTWPGGARVALWVAPNFEHYEYLPNPVTLRDPWPRTPHPDVLGYSGKDYGNRVGIWRMLEVLDRHRVRCTVSLGIANFEHYPEIVEACEARAYDYMCHGTYNTQYVWGFDAEQERAHMADCIESLHRLTGRSFSGWFPPAASHTVQTPDLVAEFGLKYYVDFYHDDQPFPVSVRRGRLISMPYSMDLNDSVIYHHNIEGAEFLRMIKDSFDVLYREGEQSGRVMNIALHPYMMGQPHRMKYVDEALSYILSHDGVWLATAAEIADWYYQHHYDRVAHHLARGEG